MRRAGQMTIFIIVALILLSAVLIFFITRSEFVSNFTGGKAETNPQAFFDSCLQEKFQEGLDLISSQGGYISNSLNKKFQFSDEKSPSNISYLCYNQNNYLPCINQEPLLMDHLTGELTSYISEDVSNCFYELAKSLEEEGNVVDARYNNFSVLIIPKKIVVELGGEVILTKSGETTILKNLRAVYPTRFYELATVVQEIVAQEARFCSFNQLGFMLVYTDYDIDKFRTGDSTIIYRVKSRDSGEEIKFAIRGCVIPPNF